MLVILASLAIASSQPSGNTDFIPTSEAVKIAGMVARDEGFAPNGPGVYFDELRTPEGREPIPGYYSIGLFRNGEMIRSYAIRIETADVIETNKCQLFHFPDLIRYQQKLTHSLQTRKVKLVDLEEEVGCDDLKIIATRGS